MRIAQAALLSLRVDGRASSYYLFEIARAIDCGMLLAAIMLSTTLLELWVRDLLVVRKVCQHKVTSRHESNWLLTKIDRELEGLERGAQFSQMARQLHELEVINAQELAWLQATQRRIRNTLHHGLTGRLLNPEPAQDLLQAPSSKEAMLLASIWCSLPTDRLDQFETLLDREVPALLEDVVNFLAAHPLPRAAPPAHVA